MRRRRIEWSRMLQLAFLMVVQEETPPSIDVIAATSDRQLATLLVRARRKRWKSSPRSRHSVAVSSEYILSHTGIIL